MWPHSTDTTDWVSDRGVQNVFFYLGSVFKKPLIWFGISLVWFGLKNAVWLDIIVIYYSCNSNYYSDNG